MISQQAGGILTELTVLSTLPEPTLAELAGDAKAIAFIAVHGGIILAQRHTLSGAWRIAGGVTLKFGTTEELGEFYGAQLEYGVFPISKNLFKHMEEGHERSN